MSDRAHGADRQADGTITVTRTCISCGRVSEVSGLNADAFAAWIGGMRVQEAFPLLSADAREALISGTCAECWERLWA